MDFADKECTAPVWVSEAEPECSPGMIPIMIQPSKTKIATPSRSSTVIRQREIRAKIQKAKASINLGVQELMANPNRWNKGLCEFYEDPIICKPARMSHAFISLLFLGLVGLCCPCLLIHRVASRVSDAPIVYSGLFCFCPVLVALRYKIRERYDIEEGVEEDAMASGQCVCCFTVCQLGNEIKSRGEWDCKLDKYDDKTWIRQGAAGIARAAARRVAGVDGAEKMRQYLGGGGQGGPPTGPEFDS